MLKLFDYSELIQNAMASMAFDLPNKVFFRPFAIRTLFALYSRTPQVVAVASAQMKAMKISLCISLQKGVRRGFDHRLFPRQIEALG